MFNGGQVVLWLNFTHKSNTWLLHTLRCLLFSEAHVHPGQSSPSRDRCTLTFEFHITTLKDWRLKGSSLNDLPGKEPELHREITRTEKCPHSVLFAWHHNDKSLPIKPPFCKHDPGSETNCHAQIFQQVMSFQWNDARVKTPHLTHNACVIMSKSIVRSWNPTMHCGRSVCKWCGVTVK